MEKPVCLTTNKGKFAEAQYLFEERYGLDIKIKDLDFEIIKILTFVIIWYII